LTVNDIEQSFSFSITPEVVRETYLSIY